MSYPNGKINYLKKRKSYDKLFRNLFIPYC